MSWIEKVSFNLQLATVHNKAERGPWKVLISCLVLGKQLVPHQPQHKHKTGRKHIHFILCSQL